MKHFTEIEFNEKINQSVDVHVHKAGQLQKEAKPAPAQPTAKPAKAKPLRKKREVAKKAEKSCIPINIAEVDMDEFKVPDASESTEHSTINVGKISLFCDF